MRAGHAAFSTEINTILREHLLTDSYILSHSEREIATIAALISMGGVESMVHSHFKLGLSIGLSSLDLINIISIVEKEVDKNSAENIKPVLNNVLRNRIMC